MGVHMLYIEVHINRRVSSSRRIQSQMERNYSRQFASDREESDRKSYTVVVDTVLVQRFDARHQFTTDIISQVATRSFREETEYPLVRIIVENLHVVIMNHGVKWEHDRFLDTDCYSSPSTLQIIFCAAYIRRSLNHAVSEMAMF